MVSIQREGNKSVAKMETNLCKLSDSRKSDQSRKASNNNDNNNHEDYHDEYEHTEGKQSREFTKRSGSSFSSASCSEGSEEFSDSSSSEQNEESESLGRSPTPSSDNCPASSLKVSNSHSNLIMESDKNRNLVDSVRVEFMKTVQDDKTTKGEGAYDQLDLEELAKSLPKVGQLEQSLAFRLISRFINFKIAGQELNKKELDGALGGLSELLKFRHHYRLSQSIPEQYCKEFYVMSGIFPFGLDKHQVPVLYLRARVHRRWSDHLDDTFRRYVAWQIDTITKSNHGAKVIPSTGDKLAKDGSFGICFDCLNVGYSSVDMDFLRFIVKILVNYYPTYCRYALCVNLPWLLRSVWKLVRSWLPEDAQSSVQLITSAQLLDYIDVDQIPNSLKLQDLQDSEKLGSGKHPRPKNWSELRDFDEMARELGLSSSEIKQFKTHLEKIRKEYEQLEAI